MDEVGLVKTDVDLEESVDEISGHSERETVGDGGRAEEKYDICTGDTGRGLCCHRFNSLPRVMVVAEVAACYPADSDRSLEETEWGMVEEKRQQKNTKLLSCHFFFSSSCFFNYAFQHIGGLES